MPRLQRMLWTYRVANDGEAKCAVCSEEFVDGHRIDVITVIGTPLGWPLCEKCSPEALQLSTVDLAENLAWLNAPSHKPRQDFPTAL